MNKEYTVISYSSPTTFDPCTCLYKRSCKYKVGIFMYRTNMYLLSVYSYLLYCQYIFRNILFTRKYLSHGDAFCRTKSLI